MPATIRRDRAIKLLNQSEFKLYEATRRGRVDDHGLSRLQQMQKSAKRLHDKYRDLAFKQTAVKRGTAAPRQGDALRAENTKAKQNIFLDILDRLEAAEKKARQRPNPEKPKQRPSATRKKQKATRKKAAAKTAVRKKSAKKVGKKATPKKPLARSNTAPKSKKVQRKGLQAAVRTRLAHSTARGKRTQAKRDSRRG